MIFFLRKVKKESAETHIFPSAVCSLSGWKLSLKSSPPPIWGTDFLAVSMSSSTLLLSRGAQLLSCYCRVFHNHEENIVNASPQHCSHPPYPCPFLPLVAVCDEAQPVPRWRWSRPRWRLCCFLLPSPCWMRVLLLSNVFLCILHGAENNGAACSLLKAVPIPPGMKNATSKTPQMLNGFHQADPFLALGGWDLLSFSPATSLKDISLHLVIVGLGRDSHPQKNTSGKSILRGWRSTPLHLFLAMAFFIH